MITRIVGALLFCAGVSLLWFTYHAPATSEISILKDVTDKHLSKPNADEILKLYNFRNNVWQGAVFRFSHLSDVSYNKTREVKIAPENKWLGNEFKRKKDVEVFEDGVTNIIAESETDSIGKSYSSVYRPMAEELIRLSESRAETKTLIVYSDLMQNDLDVSLYDDKQFQLLEANPDSMKKFIEKELHLPSLSGITVYLIYQPENAVKDKEFEIVSRFYKNLLEEKGAKVYVSANLSN